jgi:tRNA threonylcarbamoyladenosine biosynthesis protein TsaB
MGHYYLVTMLVLALDTTTRAGSCALVRDGEVLRELASDASRPPAARLPGELVDLLALEQRTLKEIDIFAVATGPGSFTGLRIGIATMQGLAFAEGKPLLGISGLDALHHSIWRPAKARQGDRVATWVDAWRGEVYAALYEEGREVAPPIVADPADLLAGMGSVPTIFIGDGAATYAELIGATCGAHAVVADPVTPLLAGQIGRLATNAVRAGERPGPHAIRPLYVRRPDAELANHALLDRRARR